MKGYTGRRKNCFTKLQLLSSCRKNFHDKWEEKKKAPRGNQLQEMLFTYWQKPQIKLMSLNEFRRTCLSLAEEIDTINNCP